MASSLYYFLEVAHSMDLEFLTTVLLVLVFIAAELYRVFWSQRGVILSLKERDAGVLFTAGATACIRLADGNEITLDIPPCTLCLGRLCVGEEVRVTRSKSGYSVDLPWSRKRIWALPGHKCDLEQRNTDFRGA